MSINNTDPSTLFGGTWKQLEDRFLLGAGSAYIAGNTGGEATHKLTIDEMPSHNHSLNGGYARKGDASGPEDVLWAYAYHRNSGSAGGDSPHNNMPPYLVVYMWKRTA